MARLGLRTLGRGMTFPFIRLPCGMAARAQREARGPRAERPDKGRGRPRTRAAAPMGNRLSDRARRRLPQGNQRGRSARAMHSVLSCRPEGGGAKRSRLPACHPLLDAWSDDDSGRKTDGEGASGRAGGAAEERPRSPAGSRLTPRPEAPRRWTRSVRCIEVRGKPPDARRDTPEPAR